MSQTQIKNLLTIREASHWASNFLKRDISESNISYLVQYGKVRRHNGGASVFVDTEDLKKRGLTDTPLILCIASGNFLD